MIRKYGGIRSEESLQQSVTQSDQCTNQPVPEELSPNFPHDLIRHRQFPVDAFVAGDPVTIAEAPDSSKFMHLGYFAEKIDDSADTVNSTTVYTDISKSQVVMVSGVRGEGKTTTAAVFCEEALRLGHTVIAVSAVNSFNYVGQPNEDRKCLENLEKLEIKPEGISRIKYLSLGGQVSGEEGVTLTLSAGEQSVDDLLTLLGISENGPQAELISVLRDQLSNGYNTIDNQKVFGIEMFSIEDMRFCLRHSEFINSVTQGFSANTKQSTLRRLLSLASQGVVSEHGTDLATLLVPGQMTVLDVSNPDVTASVKDRLVGWLARRLLNLGINGKLATITDKPIWLVVDEAQTFFENNRGAADDITMFAKMGRQFNLSLLLATQQPSSIPKPILSQVDIVVQHRLIHVDDIDAFRRCAPAVVPREFFANDGQVLRSLRAGRAIYADRRVPNRPFIMAVRPSKCATQRPTSRCEVVTEIYPEKLTEVIPEIEPIEIPDAINDDLKVQPLTKAMAIPTASGKFKPLRSPMMIRLLGCFAIGLLFSMLASELIGLADNLRSDKTSPESQEVQFAEPSSDSSQVETKEPMPKQNQKNAKPKPKRVNKPAVPSRQKLVYAKAPSAGGLRSHNANDQTALARTMEALEVLEEK